MLGPLHVRPSDGRTARWQIVFAEGPGGPGDVRLRLGFLDLATFRVVGIVDGYDPSQRVVVPVTIDPIFGVFPPTVAVEVTRP
jgi:hypothetical protein